MFSEDYRRGVCLNDLDVGLDWNALIIKNLTFLLFKNLTFFVSQLILPYFIKNLVGFSPEIITFPFIAFLKTISLPFLSRERLETEFHGQDSSGHQVGFQEA